MAAQDSTETLEARLADVDLLRRRVLNVIPHALRTPITTFRGLANALANASEEEIRDHIAPALQRLAAQAEHLLDDMLVAAGVSTALPTAPPVALEVAATAAEVWASLGQPAASLEVTGEPRPTAALAPGVLFKVLVHVLDNAARYGHPPVVVDVNGDGARTSVTIIDQGSISTADAASAFEPFYRGEAAVMAGAGLGVGLTVARALVVQAGGQMRLDVVDGHARVGLELPAR